MKVTFLGTGTSQGVPLIACQCPVCKSADSHDKRLRSSVMIENNGRVIIIDSGPDFRQQMLRADVRRLDALIFTHEHKDHIAGMDDIRAFNFIMKQKIDIYATERVQAAIRREFPYIFDSVKYPGIPEINLKTICHRPFVLFGLEFIPIEVKHYLLPVFGYRIGDFTYITDAKSIEEPELDKIRGCHTIVLNALRREHHVSHFTLTEAVQLLGALKCKQGYLTHISHQMGCHAEVERELPENIHCAYDGLTLEF
ncbi:MAG: MBL fold metallo-hydrolase [Bacteroidia bacterium]|nr:MBL fold metallo-hydrolase [Bacteroidia bacterium]MCZ2277646.1 MBL fold metallo-hydrolase [Bacteroidia bacterium]